MKKTDYLRCTYCGLLFKNSEFLKKHMKKHFDLDTYFKENKIPSSKRKFRIKECIYCFNDLDKPIYVIIDKNEDMEFPSLDITRFTNTRGMPPRELFCSDECLREYYKMLQEEVSRFGNDDEVISSPGYREQRDWNR